MPVKEAYKEKERRFSHVYGRNAAESLLSDSPLSDFLSPFRPAATQWVAKYVFISFAVIIRFAVGLGLYSGYKSEPMHGDFEAQRHWLEITYHLPIKDWYFFDLQWWGLDYPPLTAYHSWLLGVIGNFINPTWFELNTSRGLDDPNLKSYMRATAVFSELFIYMPAVISYIRWVSKRQELSPISQSIAGAAILFQPALILIDHGHFQYNSVMLGFSLLTMVSLMNSKVLKACFFFVSALMFKQMALYYSPVVFAYLLGLCVFPRLNFKLLTKIGIATIASFAFYLAPLYIFGGMDTLQQMVIRIFPFSRGLWEDKVANFWCVANTVIKFKDIFTNDQLQKLSLLATLVSILPAMIASFVWPKKQIIPWAFASCAWGFFLFSFQVHEKSVLLPLMPTTMLIANSIYAKSDAPESVIHANETRLSLIFWINNVAMFSLWPLLKREGLVLQFFATTLCWNWLIGNFNFLTQFKLRTYLLPSTGIFWKLILVITYALMFAYHIIEWFVPAPARYPDIFVITNATLSFGCFGLFWLYTLFNLYVSATTPEPKIHEE